MTNPPIQDEDDIFAIFEAELAADKQRQEAVKERDRLRKQVKSTRDPAIVAQARARLSEIAAFVEAGQWANRALVCLIHVNLCRNCGSTHESFGPLMVERYHEKRKIVSCERIAATDADFTLPKSVYRYLRHSDLCAACSPGLGFNLQSGAIQIGSGEAKEVIPFTDFQEAE